MTNEAFTERIIAMQETLYRVSYSILPQAMDREDAVQECIRKAWQKRDSLREERYMQTWVTRILINECYALLRRKKRELPTDELPEREAPPDADLSLHDLFVGLDEKLRLPAVLYYIEEFKTREIATMLRLPEGTVKSRLSRARERMREDYAREEVRRV